MGDGTRSGVDRRDVCYACGQRHANACLIKLPDGREVGLQSEDYRRWCEAKWVLQLLHRKWQREYLDKVEQKRGEQARYSLIEDIRHVQKYTPTKSR